MPLDVAVIVPAYNRADFLPATLTSILAQTVPPAEVLVVDDGSTDATPEVVARFAPAVRYHRIDNSGVCRARNTGVALTAAPWIAFCDSDDLWLPERLALGAELVERAPEVEYVFTDFEVVLDDRVELASKFASLPADYWEVPRRQLGPELLIIEEPFYARIVRRQPIFAGSTVLMRRSFFDRVGGFDERLGRTRSEDLEFTLRCLQEAPIGVVQRPVVRIRKHAANFSGDIRSETAMMKTHVGEIEILRLALQRHAFAERIRPALQAEIRRRTLLAADMAFRLGDDALTRSLIGSLPLGKRGIKAHVKLAITRLPAGLRESARRLLTRPPPIDER